MKKMLLGITVIISIIVLSGCKKDSMENISIYTTTYPIEYITKELYGNYSTISSIYPNEIIELSDKLISDYSNTDLFVYNGLSNEKDYAVKMLNNNKNLMIVDATMNNVVIQTEDGQELIFPLNDDTDKSGLGENGILIDDKLEVFYVGNLEESPADITVTKLVSVE